MNITKVQIHINKKRDDGPVKAWADIIIDDEFIVRGLVVIEAADSTHYVNMPNKVKKDPSNKSGKELRMDIAHPITEECRQYIEGTVLDEYEAVLTKIQNLRDAKEKSNP